MRKQDIPNVISIMRIVLVLPVILLLLADAYLYALILFFIAGVSDGVDGFLARYYGWQSRLGSILDPLADKLLLVFCYLTLGWLEHLPWWLVAAVIIRDIVIVSGTGMYHWLIEDVEMRPTMLSKLNTVMQLSLIVVLLISLADIITISSGLITWLIYGTLVTTLVSGMQYVAMWCLRAHQINKTRDKP